MHTTMIRGQWKSDQRRINWKLHEIQWNLYVLWMWGLPYEMPSNDWFRVQTIMFAIHLTAFCLYRGYVCTHWIAVHGCDEDRWNYVHSKMSVCIITSKQQHREGNEKKIGIHNMAFLCLNWVRIALYELPDVCRHRLSHNIGLWPLAQCTCTWN